MHMFDVGWDYCVMLMLEKINLSAVNCILLD